ncbi:MAG: hypothetical protein WB341_16615 [Terracidiphilus sp.]
MVKTVLAAILALSDAICGMPLMKAIFADPRFLRYPILARNSFSAATSKLPPAPFLVAFACAAMHFSSRPAARS